MDAQDQDLGPEIKDELDEETVEPTPPEAFYTALRNALRQLEQQPREAHIR